MPPPPYLRGTLLQLYTLRETLKVKVDAEMSLLTSKGFHNTPNTGVLSCAAHSLLSDLTGGGGPPPSTVDPLIELLHEDTFENFNNWALMCGGRCVYSSRLTHLPPHLLSGPALVGLPSPPPTYASLSLLSTRLSQLALWYAIRTESANLRFASECLCWIFHQMSTSTRFTPSPECLAAWAAAADPRTLSDSSFFSATTIAPLYNVLRKGPTRTPSSTKPTKPPLLPALLALLTPCCGHRGKALPPLRNSEKSNYDDLNEFFWAPLCLTLSYHTGGGGGVAAAGAAAAGAAAAGAAAAAHPTIVSALSSSGGRAPKTFLEKASWGSIILSLARSYSLQFTALHAIGLVAAEVVRAGGTTLSDVVSTPILPLLFSTLGCVETLAVCQVLTLALAIIHDSTWGCSGGPRTTRPPHPPFFSFSLPQLLYTLVWGLVILAVSQSQPLLGIPLATLGSSGVGGGLVWVGVAGLRLACLGVAEGLPPFCACSRRGGVRGVLMELEGTNGMRVMGSLPTQAASAYGYGGGCLDPAHFHVCGPGFMVQSLPRVLLYGCFWGICMVIKGLFDAQALIQQLRLVRTVQDVPALVYNPFWTLQLLGYKHALIVAGSWATIIALVAVDSYLCFVLLAPIIGYYTLRKDGLGSFNEDMDVKVAFLRGLRSSTKPSSRGHSPPGAAGGPPSLHAPPTPTSSSTLTLAAKFLEVCLPLAGAHKYGSGLDFHTVFRRPWDHFVGVLREGDLISNQERTLLLYGDSVTEVQNQLPLFMYAGRLKGLLGDINAIVASAAPPHILLQQQQRQQRQGRGQWWGQPPPSPPPLTDQEWLLKAIPSAATEEAILETILALPRILAHVAGTHSAIGFEDPHLLATLTALFSPVPELGVRGTLWKLLGESESEGEGEGEGGGWGEEVRQRRRQGSGALPPRRRRRRRRTPQEVLKEGFALAAALCTAFDRGTHTRLRGSPLISLSSALIEFMCELWGLPPLFAPYIPTSLPPPPSSSSTSPTLNTSPISSSPSPLPSHAVKLSLPGTSLDALYLTLADTPLPPLEGSTTATSTTTTGSSSVVGGGGGGVDTRSARGVVFLMNTPNEGGGGTLDGGGDRDVEEVLCSLREAAGRVYLLLTLEHAQGRLCVAEAERRLSWLINALFMPQVPTSPTASPLHMPSLSMVTPHYNEPILYSKEGFLQRVNENGVSPMVYLKALHAQEWCNFCERLGVGGEEEAWEAVRDGGGEGVSGELEVRLWASHRGQTLANTIDGLISAADAIRLLATLQIELEYAALEVEEGEGEQGGQGDQGGMGPPPGAAPLPPRRKRRSNEEVEEDASQAALWFTRHRYQYVLAAQRYGEHGEEDVIRRAEIDTLLLRHPLLSCAYWETSPPLPLPVVVVVGGGGGGGGGGLLPPPPPPPPPSTKGPMVVILKSGHPGYALAGGNGRSSNGEGGAGGMLFRLPAPGNPIMDKFGEGKPHNQLNAITFITGRVIQTLDMNQQGYWESNLLLPNALSLLLPLPSTNMANFPATTTTTTTTAATASAAITTVSPLAIAANAPIASLPLPPTATRAAGAGTAVAAVVAVATPPQAAPRPLVCVGLREHIFTHTLSAPAYFMAQQELLFGTMWQRIMASPLYVRLHYGHPDLLSSVWVGNRGGCAKASAVVNVSEDIFAGYSIALRGGESGHVEFLSVGKGRDVGLLQIEVFESKISGGTAISGTTRDAFRFLSSLDFPRLLSAFHTGIGFYVSNVLVLFSLVLTLYYMAALTLSGLADAVQRSNFVYLLGQITLLQWVLQLGVLSVVPLAVLYCLEHGVVKGLRKTLHLFTGLSPIFFMFEIATKAVFFDAALAFGSQGYLATGRDFVIKHVPFPEVYAAAAHSHMYLGGETLVLLLSITATGSFDTTSTYVFFFLTGWLFTFSLLGAPLFFNPGACEWRHLKADWRAWVAWMWDGGGVGAGTDTASSWRAWHRVAGEGAYATASGFTRVWRAVRVSRLAFLAALIIGRLSGKSTLAYLVYHVGLPFGTLAGLQVASWLVSATKHSLLPPPTLPHTPHHTNSSFSSSASASASASAAGTGIATTSSISVHAHPPTSSPPSPPPSPSPCLPYFSLALTLTILTATTFTLLILLPSLGAYVLASLSDLLWVTVAHFLLLAWASRLVLILNFRPLYSASITLWRALDAVFGTLILAIQCALSLAIPFASLCHTRVMYSRSYSEVVEVINGSRDALSGGVGGGGGGGGGGYLGGHHH